MRRYNRKVSAWGGGGGGSNYVVLPLPQADLSTATADGNRPPELFRMLSTGAATANTPKVAKTYARFASTGVEVLQWTRHAPLNYRSGGEVYIDWKSATGTSGAVQWKCAFAPVLPSTDDDAIVYNAATIGSGTTTATAQGKIVRTTLRPSVSGLQAGRMYTLMVGRHATGAADTMGGDAVLTALGWSYTG